MIAGLLLTLVFATFFTAFQGYEYVNAPFDLSDGIYGSTFYMLTGLHGFHVIVGTLFLAVALIRGVYHHYTRTNHIGYECAA
jgi:heme/copper-type cytochrome/quinol oxidase subunit 3